MLKWMGGHGFQKERKSHGEDPLGTFGKQEAYSFCWWERGLNLKAKVNKTKGKGTPKEKKRKKGKKEAFSQFKPPLISFSIS